jgi:radical SAM protein with 4Fe4S-binding SPASM domain
MKDNFLKKADVLGFLELDDHTNDLNPAKKDDESNAKMFPPGYKSKFVCSQLISRLTILEYGAVCPCCIDIDATLKLGDANTEKLKDIWNSKKLKELRKLHIEGKFYAIPTCRTCDWALKEDNKLRNTKVNG